MEAVKCKKKTQSKKPCTEEASYVDQKPEVKEVTALCMEEKKYCDPPFYDHEERETLLYNELIYYKSESPKIETPVHDDYSCGENVTESGTELSVIDHETQIYNSESAPTDFQNNLPHSLCLKENVSIENSLKQLSLLSFEEDEFSQLSELANQPNDIKPFTESQLLSIYRNEELELLDKFVYSFIEVELHTGATQQHPLYALLLNYLRAREKQIGSANEIEILLKGCKEIQQRLWLLETVKVTESGECQDGNPVEASHEYQVGKFEQSSYNSLATKLANVRELVNEQHSLYTYSCQVSKLKVDSYLCQVTEKFSSLPHNMPVCLASDSITRTTDLCSAISVLFHFQRQPILDVEFKQVTKTWLTRLIAILLRVSAWSQHMFILNHVLRCPSNVIKWAACFVQVPSPPFNCQNAGNYLNHMIATLGTIIKPVADRDRFIPEVEGVNEEVWVFVDSDGEDNEETSVPPTFLKENDIITILNQIPLDSMFRQMMQLTKKDDVDVYISLSSSQLLRVFAMSRLLMKILSDGMRSYENKSHSQFCKRLASILTHAMQYVTDLWEAFRKENTECHDLCLIERLQLEYDNIVIFACHSLLVPQHKTVLQFLTALPFSSVSLKTIWHLFHVVMQPPKTEISFCKNANEWWIGVEELIPSLSEVELYYVLTAVSNMALARSLNDWLFIKAVTNHLLQIGFINTSTRDNCYKISRTLLSNLANKYPSLVSVILDKLKHCIPQAGNLSLYLFREIPLGYWMPNKDDLSLIEHWLLTCPFGSIEGSLARYILSNMHWGLCHNSSRELFLKREIHCHVALLVVRLALLHCPETSASSGTAITDTIKQMSQLTSSMGRNQSEYCLSAWVWEMLFKLRLHLMDQPDPYVWATLSNPMQYFSILPSLESLPSELSPLVRALKDKQMTAMFLALLMTSTGHSIPLICNTGFSMLLSLTQCHRYFAVLFILQHIIPLFVECQEAILSNEGFIQVIQGLVTADKTFLRLAKNLISTDFPGMIVKQFGDLLQIHLDTYHKYNLSSPAPLVQLWLEILAKVWMFEPTNTSYLMDIILRTAFFRPQLRSITSGVLLGLYEAIPNTNKSKFSLVNWVVGSSQCVSLIPKSTPDTPWFALFALELEEHMINEKTGLWKQLLVSLVTSVGKTNIDSSLKKVCSALKMEPISSSALPIYRWSQQALDTPVDHPVLPIFWQKFFTLYLCRVPTPQGGKDIGCVGSKFFEGLTNKNYMKKLKKKLLDCKEFYEAKCANSVQVITSERKEWLENMAKLYNTFIFWLEEGSLQEPSVYLPALPPPYKPEKLSAIFHNDSAYWHEYVDYETVRLSQRESFNRWELSLCRKNEMPAKPSFIEQDADPLVRITKRLQSYETPLPPPPLKTTQQPVPLPPIDAFYNKHHLFDFLNGSFKTLLDFAKSHAIRVGEATSLDCCLLELAPLLYRSVETTVTLHAACDTHMPGYKPALNSLNCAGPAIINLKVCEIRVCEATDVAIHNNRVEMLNLIKSSCQPPPYSLCQGSVQVEQCVRFLEDKYSELRRTGDIQLMRNMEEVGVGLFYHLTSLFTEEVSQYPPLKQLITTCVETLGQTFICSDERQAPILLSTLLEAPSLSSLLSIHFSPTKASSQTYIQLYRTLTKSISSSNYDLIFVLLTKFDISQWLDSQKPRMSDCSQLIELVGKALASSGQTQEQEYVMIHEVLRRQLCVLFNYDSPSHYLEVITMCLNHSETHSLATEVWADVINALVSPICTFRNHLSLSDSVQLMQKFAIQQNILSYNELIELCLLLSRHFMEERLQYGLYGLYPKYRNYISPFTTLLGIISHSLVVACNKKYNHSNSSKVGQELWPYFTGLYAPWLSPYYTNSLTQPMAAWIQQLTDDRSILPPWIAADSGHAHKVAAIFTESIRFLFDNLPGSTMLSYVWQYYVTTFAHPSVKEHILSVVHSNLLSLPWSKFSPSFLDLDYMLKVSDTYVPYCHTLLGTIFIDISWANWITTIPEEASAKVHSSLLHLIIKLSNEPNVRQSGKIMDLLNAACTFKWEMVDSVNYESAINWFVMSYDPRVILVQENDDTCDIDRTVLELLRHAGGFVPTMSSTTNPPSMPRKRQVYVRACVKLLVSCYNRYKQALRTDLDALSSTIDSLLTQVNTVVPLNPYAGGEAGLYTSELLTLLSGPLVKATHSTMLSWLGKRGDSVIAKALLRTLPLSVQDPVILGSLMEATLSAVFNDQNGGDWTSVLGQLQDFPPRQSLLVETFASERYLLSLYAYFCKRLPVLTDLEEEAAILKDLTSSLSAVKCCSEIEAKLVPLFYLGLLLGGRQADHNPELTYSLLKQLVAVSESWADYKSPWGFLGTIGIRKQVQISNRCRVMCRVFAALVLCQFPERKGELNIDQPPFIRTTAHAPGGITSNNMELGPGSETIRCMSLLECLSGDKGYSNFQLAVERGLGLIRGPDNSLHNAATIFLSIASLMFPERFVTGISTTQSDV